MSSSKTSSPLRFALRRLSNTVRLLTTSRLAIVGIILLVTFVVGALVAPLIFPINPQAQVVGSSNAPPEWLSYFPEGYYYSRNMVVVNNPDLSTPSSLQQFNYATNPTSSSPQVSFSFSPSSPGGGNSTLSGVKITSTSSNVTTVSMSESFYYPYHGPPASFAVSGIFFPEGASPSTPVTISFFLSRGGYKSFNLGTFNLTQSPALTGNTALTLVPSPQAALGSIPIQEAIFANINTYAFGITVTFSGPGTLYVERLVCNILGTSFGLLGTDNNGYDLFAQDLYGTRSSLVVGLLASFIGISLGLLVGLLAGYKPGTVDQVLMRFTDFMLVIPALPLLLVLVGVLGPSLNNIIIIIGFLGWMGFARVIRSQVLSLKERPFIEAAKAAGAGTGRILRNHIFPNVVSLTYVNLALAVPAAILTEAALSFLGLGDPSVISWGQILYRAETQEALAIWWWVVPPGIAIALVSLSFVLVGYSLDEIFNPKLRRRQ